MNPEKNKIASTQQNVESIVDKTQRVEISVTNVKKKENKLLSKTTINNISDGKFQMTEGWSIEFDSAGNIYYYNSTSGESTCKFFCFVLPY